MARYGYGMSVSGTRKSIVPSSGGVAPITTSRAFNSSGVQVGDTNTGDIPESWVQGQVTVTSVIFANDNSVTSIGSYAFAGCTSLASITIPNSVTDVSSDEIFTNCTSLTTATIGTGVTTIGNDMFSGCSALTSITIPNNVTSIGAYAFNNCTSLATATIGTGVTSIGNYAFQLCTSLTSITIPNSVTTIGLEAFASCISVTTLAIGTGATNIQSDAFNNCTSLATVTCRVAQSAFTGNQAFLGTASPLVIQARITDASWTAGVGLTFQGNTNVTVIKNL